ncbi:hypothetical protein [Erwinia sp. S59]|uniref:hypothetical protein n=1 Tax=Erwinia sp. S59 TaxID=2769340 RepID=UPI001909FC81|nr:hypothetical protein [Erwinia sp. S59]MBK0092609.1 hypothetical protein [Erwinia sp. S59]
MEQRPSSLIFLAHLINPSLHRVLLDEVPLSERSAHEEFEQQYAEFYRQFVVKTMNTDSDRVSVVAIVLASAVEGVVHDAARRDQLGADDIKVELQRLIMAYLQS